MAKKQNTAASESAADLIGADPAAAPEAESEAAPEAASEADPAAEPEAEPLVEAFVLRDSTFGMAGDVVELSAADARAGAEQGALDLHPNAIAAAKENK